MTQLDPDTAQFVVGVSAQTKIDPRVVLAWVQAEGGGTPNGVGHFNYLNLRPQAGDHYNGVTSTKSNGDFEAYKDTDQAIFSTVRRIKSGTIIEKMAYAKPTPAEQISAISHSGWELNGYAGPKGNRLTNAFTGLFGAKELTTAYMGPDKMQGFIDSVGVNIPGKGFGVGAAEKAGSNLLDNLGIGKLDDLIKWIGGNWDRVGLVFFGMIILILGGGFLLYKIVKETPMKVSKAPKATPTA